MIDEILQRYVTYLLEGCTIQFNEINVSIIEHYLTAVNTFYKSKCLPGPWDNLGVTQANIILRKKKTFEGAPERREQLHDEELAHMMTLSEASHKLSFRRAIWLWTILG